MNITCQATKQIRLLKKYPKFINYRRQSTKQLLEAAKDYKDFIPTIGLEVHAQINSKSKLFSRGSTEFHSPPNCNVDLFDASIPGTLPVLNKECLASAIRTALALNCKINTETSFDRKHYFYGDLPLGYQITQQESPIGVNGYLEFGVFNKNRHEAGYIKKSFVKQIQLEQDSGKSLHDEINGISLIDLNRAGNPLMEIVFQPDLVDGDEAAFLVRDLIILLKRLQTCTCKLEEGSLRIDANISVRPKDSSVLGTRTEVKNLNSLKSVTRAVNYEIERQIRLVSSGQKVDNETMRFNSFSGKTEIMRDKEIVMDYRFMPEGNLPSILLRDSKEGVNLDQSHLQDVDEFRGTIPLSPQEQRVVFMNKYHISLENIIDLQSMEQHLQWFTQIMEENKKRDPSIVYRLLSDQLEEVLSSSKTSIEETKVTPESIGLISDLIQEKIITYLIAQDILTLINDGKNIAITRETVESKGWLKINDSDEVHKFCQKTITAMPSRAKEVRMKGKKFAFNKMLEVTVKLSERRIEEEDIAKVLIELLKPPGGLVLNQRQRLKNVDKEHLDK